MQHLEKNFLLDNVEAALSSNGPYDTGLSKHYSFKTVLLSNQTPVVEI